MASPDDVLPISAPVRLKNDRLDDVKAIILNQQIMPEFVDVLSSFSAVSFADTGSICAINDVQYFRPRFQVCYALYYPENHKIWRCAVFNRFDDALEDMLWVVVSDRPSLEKLLLDRGRTHPDSESTSPFEDALNLHLAFCNISAIGWTQYLNDIVTRFELAKVGFICLGFCFAILRSGYSYTEWRLSIS